jgi:hypothetical protein
VGGGGGGGGGGGAAAAPTTVLLGIRRRACFELDDFLALLRESFEATPAEPADAAPFIAVAAAMSKTSYAPQLFALRLRAGRGVA